MAFIPPVLFQRPAEIYAIEAVVVGYSGQTPSWVEIHVVQAGSDFPWSFSCFLKNNQQFTRNHRHD